MNLNPAGEKVSRAQLRHLGWCIALVLVLAAWRVDGGATSWLLKAAAGAVFALGTLWPATLEAPHRLLMVITYPARWAINWVFLATVYYGVLTPVALCVRLWRPDGLQRRLDREARSYWQPHVTLADKSRYFRQF